MLKIVFEDPCLVVIDKPAGLVSTSSETQTEQTLEDLLRKYGISLDRGGLVHRLDKDTSGLIVAAKTQECFEKLQSQFAQRVVKKEYLALVHGIIDEGGVVVGEIGRNPKNREKFTVLLKGREASTEYVPMRKLTMGGEAMLELFPEFNSIQRRKLLQLDYGSYSLIKALPKTGRTHQIRVHLKYIHHPIVSDDKYGGRKVTRLDHRWCPRQFLHAERMEFRHPLTGEVMKFECELPQDLKEALRYLK